MVVLEEFKWSFSQSHFCAEKLKANFCEELQLIFSCGAWPFSTFSDSRESFILFVSSSTQMDVTAVNISIWDVCTRYRKSMQHTKNKKSIEIQSLENHACH